MNCANHPDVPVSAYCQNCGKPLCASCVRNVSGVIYCEQCLAERLGIGAAATLDAASPNAAQTGPNPAAAFLLGFIPGVGAFYNGQFIKGLVHVLIFVILVGITSHVGIFGILIAAWIAYQVFDAYHTARARREGMPLPDPFGLNEFGSRFGVANPTAGSAPRSGAGHGAGFGNRPAGWRMPPQSPVPPASGVEPPAAPADPGMPPYSNVPPPPGVMPPTAFACGSRRRPTVAVVLIVLGVLFLLNSLNFFNFNWFGKLWPVLIILFGVFLFLDHTRKLPPVPPTQGGPR